MKKDCGWVDFNNPLYKKYHDEEWGVPVHDDKKLFEMLILEGAQAGLGWSTILNKRENYRKLFDNFDAQKISKYNQAKINKLLQDPGIVRNKLKINSAIKNAKAFLEIKGEFKSFDTYLWAFVNNKPLQPNLKDIDHMPTKTPISEAISKDLKKRGMNFVGPTIIYAYMQAIGMTNDHLTTCHKYKELA